MKSSHQSGPVTVRVSMVSREKEVAATASVDLKLLRSVAGKAATRQLHLVHLACLVPTLPLPLPRKVA